MTNTTDAGPAWKTFVVQGTIAEDATAGTHICTLTVTPGAGNEMQVLYGQIQSGATATAQTGIVKVTDGTNNLAHWLTAVTLGNNIIWPFPQVGTPAAGAPPSGVPFTVSGTEQLVLSITTAAVSVTQTFAVVVRVRGLVTVTFADTVGTPTITTNTSQVF